MISNKIEYENMTIKILNSVISGQVPVPEIFPECDKKDFDQILEQCIKEELIIGLESYRVSGGSLHYDRVFQPCVTFKGLSFIDSINQANALEISKAAESKSIIAIVRSNIATIASFTAILVSVLANLDRIVHNVQKVLSYLNTP
ncbi:hypothetical protein [Lacrimispora sp.]|uniref:hypothetical protein n=1 Tax=Lacrimispora sp. TaxID=2719234 RepID=UPI00285ABC57|nr:hypothetical protein [Lacrimispora sp.]MDR7815156.1 hypothetical protein [Lacrimispora sp.]